MRQYRPVRAEQKDGDGEDDQAQADNAGHVLHDREPNPPDHDPHPERGNRHPQPGANVARQLKRQRHPADLGRHRHQVDEERGAQVGCRRTWTQAFADDFEGGPAADCGNPACHVREQVDAQHADRHHPDEG